MIEHSSCLYYLRITACLCFKSHWFMIWEQARKHRVKWVLPLLHNSDTACNMSHLQTVERGPDRELPVPGTVPAAGGGASCRGDGAGWAVSGGGSQRGPERPQGEDCGVHTAAAQRWAQCVSVASRWAQCVSVASRWAQCVSVASRWAQCVSVASR